MADEKEQVSISIDTAKEVIKNLEEKIKQLEIRESNLNAQMHSKQIEFESSRKMDELDARTRLQKERDAITTKADGISARYSQLEIEEEKFRERKIMLEKREEELIIIEKERVELNQERSNFNVYKFNVERELEQAKIVIADANAAAEKLEMYEEDLKGREAKVKQQEKFWNDRIGEVEKKEKELRIMQENFEGLKQAEEIKNG